MEGQMTFEFAKRPTIKGYPELRWTGKRPYESTQYYPAQLRERYGEETNGWINKIFWGDNLQVMSHLLKEYRGKVQLIYIDPPFDSRVDYKMKVELKGKKATNDISTFEEKQYGDIWTNDEYLQFMYERIVIMKELLSDNRTVVFVLIVVVGGMLLGLVAAVLCNKAFPGIRVFSTAYALPMAIASSSAAMIFQIMLHPTVGIVNKLLGLDINWLNDPRTALYCVAILTAWLNSGINFLYFSAGLGNIDETIYERASVDGASGVQQFFHLTLPGLSPIMFYTVVVNIIQAFQSFGQIKILTEGGPNESTNVIVYSIYRDAFFNYRFGSASAQSVILFIRATVESEIESMLNGKESVDEAVTNMADTINKSIDDYNTVNN